MGGPSHETSMQARWYLVWVHERCQKLQSATFSAALQRKVHAKGGRICFMKKAHKFAKWLSRSVPDSRPYVLLTDWREVKPCFEAICVDPAFQSPMATIVVVPDERSYLRANTWCKEQREKTPNKRVLVMKDAERAENIIDKVVNDLADLQSQGLAQMFAEHEQAATGELVKFNSNRSVQSMASAPHDLADLRSQRLAQMFAEHEQAANITRVSQETRQWSSNGLPVAKSVGDLEKFKSNRSVLSMASESTAASASEYAYPTDLHKCQELRQKSTFLSKDCFCHGSCVCRKSTNLTTLFDLVQTSKEELAKMLKEAQPDRYED